MHNEFSRAPRRIDPSTMISGLLTGVPKGTVLTLFAVTGWSVAALTLAGAGRGLLFLARHWPF